MLCGLLWFLSCDVVDVLVWCLGFAMLLFGCALCGIASCGCFALVACLACWFVGWVYIVVI